MNEEERRKGEKKWLFVRSSSEISSKLPSEISGKEYSWIAVTRIKDEEEEDEEEFGLFCLEAKEKLNELKERLQSKKREKDAFGKTITKDDYRKRCAQWIIDASPNKGGKWLINRDPDKVDETWTKIANSFFGGALSNLACAAKVSTSDVPPSKHVICVYAKNYADIINVQNLAMALHGLGCKPQHFKANCFTHLVGNVGNVYGLKTTQYTYSIDEDKHKFVGALDELGKADY